MEGGLLYEIPIPSQRSLWNHQKTPNIIQRSILFFMYQVYKIGERHE